MVNATGPWTDEMRRLEDGGDVTPMLRRTKGAHVVVPRARIGHTDAITFLSPLDGRVMFMLPWGEQSYIGTTDTDTDRAPGRGARLSRRRALPAALGEQPFPRPTSRRTT